MAIECDQNWQQVALRISDDGGKMGISGAILWFVGRIWQQVRQRFDMMAPRWASWAQLGSFLEQSWQQVALKISNDGAKISILGSIW